jgi:hypothetical protein
MCLCDTKLLPVLDARPALPLDRHSQFLAEGERLPFLNSWTLPIYKYNALYSEEITSTVIRLSIPLAVCPTLKGLSLP